MKTESGEQRRSRLAAELKRRQETVHRMDEAVRRILEVSTELHLTWRQFEDVLSQVKEVAYVSSGSRPDKTS